MNRRLKFRAWHNTKKSMVNNLIISMNGNLYDCSSIGDDVDFDDFKKASRYNDDLDTYIVNDEVELMQWTGLFDKHHTPIFEGDILQFSNKAEWYGGMAQEQLDKLPFKRGVVEWDSENGCWTWGFGTHTDLHRFIEVIGNIYEHSHLLEKEQSI